MPSPSDLEIDLDTLVRGYEPSGDEWSHERAMQVLDNKRPMWPRVEFDPGHFTASAFVVSPDGNSLLLIHHGKLDRWLQPGGHIEPEDASVEGAARREVSEETGVSSLRRLGESLVRIDVHEIPERDPEPEHLHLDLGVGFVAHNIEIGPLTEVLDARWVSLDDLEAYGADGAVTTGAEAVRHLLG